MSSGFPNASSAPGFYRKLGWVELRPYPLLVRPLGNARDAFNVWKPRLAPIGSLIGLLTPLLRAFDHVLMFTGGRGSLQFGRSIVSPAGPTTFGRSFRLAWALALSMRPTSTGASAGARTATGGTRFPRRVTGRFRLTEFPPSGDGNLASLT